MGKKRMGKKVMPEKAKVVENPRADPPAERAQVEPEVPAVQTPTVSSSQAGTSQTPTQTPVVPLDAVLRLIQSLSPGLSLKETLTRITAGTQASTVTQITAIPTPQLPSESTQPIPDQTTSSTQPRIFSDDPKIPRPEIPSKPSEAQVGTEVIGIRLTESEDVVEAEELLAAREREMKTKVDEEELVNQEDGDEETREATEVLERSEADEEASVGGDDEKELESEEHSEENPEVSSEDSNSKEDESQRNDEGTDETSEGKQERREEEGEVVNKEKRKREKEYKTVMRKSVVQFIKKVEEPSGVSKDIKKSGDDDIEIIREEKQEVGTAERAIERRRFSRRLADILTSGGALPVGEVEKKVKSIPSDAGKKMRSVSPETEEEEEAEVPLQRRPRTTKPADPVGTPAETTRKEETDPVGTPANLIEEEAVDEAKYQQERKRKGKLPERLVKKRVRKANPNVVIQEPIPVPFQQAKEESDEEMSEEEGGRK